MIPIYKTLDNANQSIVTESRTMVAWERGDREG